MKPFFTFYGGKWRAALRYPMPEYERVIEPFAGAAGYSLRHWRRKVLLVEKDPCIAALWKYLIRTPASEIIRLPLWEPGMTTVDSLSLPQEAKSLIGFWLNKGCSRPSKSPSAWMRIGSHAKSFWGKTIRERIARQVDHIRHWQVIEGDYSDVPNQTATWFIDPPYMSAGQHYACGSKGIDFVHLGDWCRARRGQVIVCEGPRADWLPFRPFIQIKANESATGGKVSHEYVWMKTEESNFETALADLLAAVQRNKEARRGWMEE